MDRLKEAVFDHPVLSVLVFVGMVVVAVAAFTDAIKGLAETFENVLQTEPPPIQSDRRPAATFSVQENPNGTATIVCKFFDLPEDINVDHVLLSFRQTGPEAPILGNPSRQVESVHYDAAVSRGLLESPDPKIELETRLVRSAGDPYALAEITLWWEGQNSTIELEVSPRFLDARRNPIPFEMKAQHLVVRLANSSTSIPHRLDPSMGSDRLDQAMQTALQATTIDDLKTAAEDPRFRDPFVYEGLWYAAALFSMQPSFPSNYRLQERLMRFMAFGTLLELGLTRPSVELADGELLLNVGPEARQALHRATHLSPVGGPLDSLLARRPELREDYWRGQYRYLRFTGPVADGLKFTWVLESSDTRIGDLQPQYALTRSESIPVANRDAGLASEGYSYSFPLPAMNYFVITAKAYAYLQLLGGKSRQSKYALLIIANALYYASLHGGNGHVMDAFNRTAIFPMEQAVRAFRESPPEEGTLLQPEFVEPRLTAMRFFGRRLRAALAGYDRAARQTNREEAYRMYGRWGGAVTSMGIEDDAETSARFERLLKQIDDDVPDDDRYRYWVIAFQDVLDEDHAVHRVLAPDRTRIAQWRKSAPEEHDRYSMNADLRRVLWTLGLYSEGAALMVREIERLPEPQMAGRVDVELEYLREMGAFLEDAFGLLSWRLDLRESLGYVARGQDQGQWLADFGPTWLDRCFDRGSGRPYGSVSPEEDRITILEGYLSASLGLGQAVRSTGDGELCDPGQSTDDSSAESGGELRAWARAERDAGNLEPLLKLAWIEWFGLPLVELGQQGVDLKQWRYRSMTEGSVATTEAVRAVAADEDGAVATETRRVARTFIAVRRFLEKRYGF